MTIVSHFFWSWYLCRTRPWVWRFACAAVAPDGPYFVLLAYYSVRSGVNGFGNLSAWDQAWKSPIVSALHSFVPWATAVLGVGTCASRRYWSTLWPIWAGWLSHIVIDMLTHHSDGYPIFYPLSAYRFPTPISYWEPGYHGRAFTLIDAGLMAIASLHMLLRRARSPVDRLATAPRGPRR